MGKGKPRGLNAARKLRNNRRDQRWASLGYKKRLLGTAFKSSPFGGSSHAKGIVLEKVGVEAKQPNSAIRKCVKVQLIKNGKKVTAFGAFVPLDYSIAPSLFPSFIVSSLDGQIRLLLPLHGEFAGNKKYTSNLRFIALKPVYSGLPTHRISNINSRLTEGLHFSRHCSS